MEKTKKKVINDIESKTPRYRELFLLETLDDIRNELKNIHKELKKLNKS